MQTIASVFIFVATALAIPEVPSADPNSLDLSSQCGGYCFNAFKPMLDLLAKGQAEKLNETQAKLESVEAQLVEIKEKLNGNDVPSKFDTSIITRINSRGFVKLGSRSFYIEDRFMLNFYSAIKMCRQMGAYLAVIQNEEELNAFSQELNERHSYWLDISRLSNTDEEKYSSLSSGKDVTFLKWAHGEPSNYFQTEACVNILNSTMTTKPCQNGYNFICEAIKQFLLKWILCLNKC